MKENLHDEGHLFLMFGYSQGPILPPHLAHAALPTGGHELPLLKSSLRWGVCQATMERVTCGICHVFVTSAEHNQHTAPSDPQNITTLHSPWQPQPSHIGSTLCKLAIKDWFFSAGVCFFIPN